MQTVVSQTFVSVHEILWCDFQMKSVIFLVVLSSANDYFEGCFKMSIQGILICFIKFDLEASLHFGTRVHDKESRT